MSRFAEGFKARTVPSRGQTINIGCIISILIIAFLVLSVASHTYTSVVADDEEKDKKSLLCLK